MSDKDMIRDDELVGTIAKLQAAKEQAVPSNRRTSLDEGCGCLAARGSLCIYCAGLADARITELEAVVSEYKRTVFPSDVKDCIENRTPSNVFAFIESSWGEFRERMMEASSTFQWDHENGGRLIGSIYGHDALLEESRGQILELEAVVSEAARTAAEAAQAGEGVGGE